MSDALRQLHDAANVLADSGLRTVKTNELCIAVYGAIDEITRLREALSSLVEAWDWWQVDPYDRCQSVPSDAINEARAALAEKEEK